MAGFVSADISHHGASDTGFCRSSKEKKEETVSCWYMSRKEIEENSPSRRDGIDLKKETYLRKSYCTFLQDLGMRLKVPQVTIATAIIFCHRFFLRQSHAKNDRRTIATICMFLAGKVEETPRPLKDVILVSYEIIHKKDPAAAQRIKQKEVYEQQKELILLGERVVLATLGFDLNVQHPYKPLVEAIKKFNVAKNALAQVAWNFVNDGLRTSLCLQFKPHHIASGATFLAAKFLKVKLPSDGEKVWWQEFGITPRQLEEVSNQMLELYEQNSVHPSQGSEVDRTAAKVAASNEEQALKSSRPAPQHPYKENHIVAQGGTENQSNDMSAAMGSVITDHKVNTDIRDSQNSEQLPQNDKDREVSNNSDSGIKRTGGGSRDRKDGRKEGADMEKRDILTSNKSSCIGQNLELREGPLGKSPKEAIKKIDKNKVKAALGKQKKVRGEVTLKEDVIDEDDRIERELEDGVELAVEDEKNKGENGQNWSKTGHVDNVDHGTNYEESRDGKQMAMKGKSLKENEAEKAEGEMIDDVSSLVNNRKRKGGSPPDRQPETKKQLDISHHANPSEDGS